MKTDFELQHQRRLKGKHEMKFKDALVLVYYTALLGVAIIGITWAQSPTVTIVDDDLYGYVSDVVYDQPTTGTVVVSYTLYTAAPDFTPIKFTWTGYRDLEDSPYAKMGPFKIEIIE